MQLSICEQDTANGPHFAYPYEIKLKMSQRKIRFIYEGRVKLLGALTIIFTSNC